MFFSRPSPLQLSVECVTQETCKGFAVENGLDGFLVLNDLNGSTLYANATTKIWKRGTTCIR